MGRYRRWVGFFIGLLFFPPFGALFGYAIGWIVDSMSEPSKRYMKDQSAGMADFIAVLLVLTAAVMKADGKVTHAELDFVKQYYRRIFGEKLAKDSILRLRDVLKKNIYPYQIISDINAHTNYHSRLQLLHFLFGIAKADGQITQAEINEITQISGYLRISVSDFESIKSMFIAGRTEIESSYKILGVDENSSNEEIKKAFRKKAVEFHPDKVANLGSDIQQAAKEKFQNINDAYNKIKKIRNIS
jgi:DnaJ like chaperone protein